METLIFFFITSQIQKIIMQQSEVTALNLEVLCNLVLFFDCKKNNRF